MISRVIAHFVHTCLRLVTWDTFVAPPVRPFIEFSIFFDPPCAGLLRIVGYKLEEVGALDVAARVFERVLGMRGNEPQSKRDLALVLGQRGLGDDFARAIDLLVRVVKARSLPCLIGGCDGLPLDRGKGGGVACV